jgi:hypothetical protein
MGIVRRGISRRRTDMPRRRSKFFTTRQKPSSTKATGLLAEKNNFLHRADGVRPGFETPGGAGVDLRS